MARFTDSENQKYFNLQITEELSSYDPLARQPIIPIKVRVPDTFYFQPHPNPPLNKSVGYDIEIDNSLQFRPTIRSSLKTNSGNGITDVVGQRFNIVHDEVYISTRPGHDRRQFETVRVTKNNK